jgi:hypothetical protein
MTTDATQTNKAREALDRARVLAKQENRKLLRRSKIEVWQNDKLSLRKSVDAKCFDCSNYQIEEVKYCTVTNCPLWHVRPFQDKKRGTDQ